MLVLASCHAASVGSARTESTCLASAEWWNVVQVTEGSGKMLVVAVGTESEWGRTMALVATEASPTPLQDALGVLATAIGKIGLTVGVICFVVLFVRCVGLPIFCFDTSLAQGTQSTAEIWKAVSLLSTIEVNNICSTLQAVSIV